MSDSFNPIQSIQEDEKRFITSYWTERAEDFRKLREKELQSPKLLLWRGELISHISSTEPLHILDVGCGAGFFSILLADLGHAVTGIDITPNMIEEANLLAKTLNSKAIFSVMDAENLEFPTHTFDMVVARNVTWNLPHPDRAYEEWLRVLKPNGMLLNYDAEHGKNHHQQLPASHHAHQHIKEELLEKCHTIYHMLSISATNRPLWDQQILEGLNATVTLDTTVGSRIYAEEDEFYIPAPMFLVKAVKN